MGKKHLEVSETHKTIVTDELLVMIAKASVKWFGKWNNLDKIGFFFNQ